MFIRRKNNQDAQSIDRQKRIVDGYGINYEEEDSDANKSTLIDYIKFLGLCFLLIVPVYAIAKSAIKGDWIMVAIDALLVPVGFVHGLLMLFGIV